MVSIPEHLAPPTKPADAPPTQTTETVITTMPSELQCQSNFNQQQHDTIINSLGHAAPVASHPFGKGAHCPSTAELVEVVELEADDYAAPYQTLVPRHIARHIAACDFCCAELDLLRHHPPLQNGFDGDCDPAPMPLHLYALALIKRRKIIPR